MSSGENVQTSNCERYSNRNVHHFFQLSDVQGSDAIQLYPDLPVPNICGSKLLRSHRVPKAQRLAVAPGQSHGGIPGIQQDGLRLNEALINGVLGPLETVLYIQYLHFRYLNMSFLVTAYVVLLVVSVTYTYLAFIADHHQRFNTLPQLSMPGFWICTRWAPTR